MEVLEIVDAGTADDDILCFHDSCRREGRGTEIDNILYGCAAGKRWRAEWEDPFPDKDRELILRRLKEI